MTEPTDAEIRGLAHEGNGVYQDDETAVWEITDPSLIKFARALLAKWGTPQQEAQEPCPTCIALARTVMLDHVSFDRKPDCYGIRQITDDEGVEEWEDIRTSPDVAREEANDMMATGRGEIYEVVPLWTTPQPTQAQAGAVPLTDEMVSKAGHALSDLYATECGIDKDDNWKVYGSDFIETAKLVLEAAHGIKGGADAINEAREMGLGEPG